jgi:hypothetical protein
VASALVVKATVLFPGVPGFLMPAAAEKITVTVVPVAAVAEFVIVTARLTTTGSAEGATPLMETVVLPIALGTVVPAGKVTVTVPSAGTVVKLEPTIV